MNAKKILAGACASLMLAAAATPIVSAADSVKVTVDNVEAEAGATFTVNISLADIPAAGINACDFGIKYDSSVVTLDGAQLGELAKEDTSLEGVNALVVNPDELGLLSVIYGIDAKADYMKGEGVFLVITGKVNADAKPGAKTDLEVVAVDRSADGKSNSSLNADIIFGVLDGDTGEGANYYTAENTVNGSVTVKGGSTVEPPTVPPTTVVPPTTAGPTDPPETLPSYTGDISALKYGDANLDNVISAADVVQVVKYVVAKDIYPLGKETDESIAQAKEQSDVTHDGLIDPRDSGRIKEAILQHITEEDLAK